MRRRRLFWLWLVAPFLMNACATLSGHDHARGTVVLSDDGKEAHVCLGNKEIKVGDKVEVFDAVCKKEQVAVIRSRRYQTKCEKIARGQAEVVDVADEHYSRVHALGDLLLKEGQIVERLQN